LPADDLALLVGAAREAGALAAAHFARRPPAREKPGGAGPVTEADLAVDAFLRGTLTAARPGYGWLSEETEDGPARLFAERVFIVDPIDGTRAFVAGEPGWALSLAVAERGEVIAAAVFLPMLERLYAAAAGRGATCNGAPVRASRRQGARGATLLAARPALAAENWRAGAPPPMERVFRPSLAHRMSLVADGRFDAMLTLRPTWEWDVAAGALLAAEAGARVSDRAGAPLRFNAATPLVHGVLAAAPAVHAELAGALAPSPAPAP